MVCGNFILPEPASYVFFYAIFNLRKLFYLIEKGKENGKEKQEHKEVEVKYAPPWVPNNRYPGRCFSLL